MSDALTAAGAPAALIEQMAQEKPESPEIQPGNVLIVHLFFCCATQWNYAGMAGVRTGLNYPAVELRATKIPEYAELSLTLQNLVWHGIQQMERTCLTCWQEPTE